MRSAVLTAVLLENQAFWGVTCFWVGGSGSSSPRGIIVFSDQAKQCQHPKSEYSYNILHFKVHQYKEKMLQNVSSSVTFHHLKTCQMKQSCILWISYLSVPMASYHQRNFPFFLQKVTINYLQKVPQRHVCYQFTIVMFP